MADHTHDHSHAHDHDHEGDSYFIDQLCLVGLSGAFGVVCLCLWFWQPPPPKTPMLELMLGPQFHIYVLLSGIVLTVLAVTRGVILWKQSRDPAFVNGHDHDHHDHNHAHDHQHEHGHAVQEKPAHAQSVQSLPMTTAVSSCGHDHGPGEACGHTHPHEHHIGHAHVDPDHDEADHDHGWAPWRYVVILVPIILFLLGLPNKPPAIMASHTSVISLPPEAETQLHVLGMGTETLAQLAYVGVAYNMQSGKGEPRAFKDLEMMARPDMREQWKNKIVEVRGQYSPVAGSNQIFMLVRLKISCCANDAVQLDVPMASREPITGIARNDWVKVTGRVEFREYGGSYKTVLIIAKASDVEKCNPDPNPYIQ